MDIDQDPASFVSDDMALVIAEAMERSESEQLVTLRRVREAMERGLVDTLVQLGRVDSAEDELSRELGQLMETFGDDAPGGRFVRARASDALSVVIEAEIDSPSAGDPPTLATVKQAMHNGLVAHLVGVGDLADEDEQPLYAEIDELIQRHGEDAPAEEFLI